MSIKILLKNRLVLLTAFIILFIQAIAQSNTDSLPHELLSKLSKSVSKKSEKVVNSLSKNSDKILNKLEGRENRIRSLLCKQDSLTISVLLGANDNRYKTLKQQLSETGNSILKSGSTSDYLPYADTIQSGLNFLLSQKSTDTKEKAQYALNKLNQSLKNISDADEIASGLKERVQQLREIADRYKSLSGSLKKEINEYGKELFYYKQQIEDAKNIFNTPGHAEKLAINGLKKVPGFEQWMAQNSQLSGMFGASTASIATNSFQLQTVESIRNLLYNNLGNNTAQVVNQQLQQAQSQLASIKEKITSQLASGTATLADGTTFRPNNQKTKPFLKRLERTFSLQAATKNGNFPTVNDLGIGIGYKLNDRKVIGVGMSYKFGLGQSIQKIKWSSEGIGLRAYLDVKWKGNLWLSGGYERDYYQRFSSLQNLRSVIWTQSALLGLTKKIKLKKREAKIQILYDFLRQNNTAAVPLLFRYGWTF